jgi:hypothetical protein
MVSEGMPLGPFHDQTEMKRRDLASIDTISICCIWHLVYTVGDNLVAVEIQIEGPLCSPANRTAEHVCVESFRRFEV